MIRLVIAGAILGGSLLVFAGISLGHGGTYRGPGDTVPSNPGGPSTPGPSGPSGPTTPGPSGPGGPTTPAPTGPVTPGGAGAPTPGGGPGISTPGMSGPDLTSWTFWWGFNREKYLQLKSKLAKQEGVFTGESAEGLLGAGGGGRDSMKPTTEQITKEVIPALKNALETETNRDIVSGCLIALAKIGQEPQQAMEMFKKFLPSKDQEIAETAALAYGILASPEGVVTLHDLFMDNDAGRKLVNQNEVSWRTRTFACYGLGLTGARTNDQELRAKVQAWLIDFLKESKRSDTRDIRVATVIALGLIPDSERKAVQSLEKYFDENRKREEIICSHIPNSIARILREASLDERKAYCDKLMAELGEKAKSSTENNFRRSMAQALGVLTRGEDPHAKKAFEVIQEKIEKELSKNEQLAYFGMIALGQISGTDEPGNAIEKYLTEKALAQGGRVMTRAWAAIALGVAAFDQQARNKTPNQDVGKALTEQMMSIKDPQQRAAYAIGLGLMRYAGASSALNRCLDEVKDDAFRGYFATGLGLMGEKDSIEKIQGLVKGATRRPEFLREAAIALGLLGDKSILKGLVDILGDKDNKTLAVQAAVATALGFVGDYRAITPLSKMLRDEKKDLSSESRAFAAVALGIVCDKEEFPWNFKISTDLNYTATTETLNDQSAQTGILNLL